MSSRIAFDINIYGQAGEEIIGILMISFYETIQNDRKICPHQKSWFCRASLALCYYVHVMRNHLTSFDVCELRTFSFIPVVSKRAVFAHGVHLRCKITWGETVLSLGINVGIFQTMDDLKSSGLVAR